MIKYIIFDLDDTLCDYQGAKQSAKCAVERLLVSSCVANSIIDQFWAQYQLIEPILFRQFLNHEIEVEDYRFGRFNDPLSQSGVANSEELAKRCNTLYMEIANHQINLFDDAIPCISLIKNASITPVILTNGPKDGQTAKFIALSLNEHIPYFFTGEGIGAAKPSIEAFQKVVSYLSCDVSEVMMVGDSLEDDYYGAMNAGISAVLLDRNNQHRHISFNRIQSLLEIRRFINIC